MDNAPVEAVTTRHLPTLVDRTTRLDTLHEVLAIVREKRAKYGALTAHGCEAIAHEIEALIALEQAKE